MNFHLRQNKKEGNSKSHKAGFSIIEVILAGSILALIVFGIVSAWLYGEHALIRAGDTSRGVAIASEGVEIMRNLRDADFAILQDGTYALANYGSGWTLLKNEQESIGAYKRFITVTSQGATQRNITSTVEWTNVDGTPGVISSSTILTNWQQLTKKVTRTSALAITNVIASPSENGVIITWTTNKAATSQVEYGTTASYGTTTSVTDTAPMVLSHSVSIGSLASNTTYHFRVISVSATAEQAYSVDATFTTSADATAPVISNIVATPGLNSVVITWTTNEASSSFVNYGATTSYGTTTTEIDNVTRVTSHSVTITGLSSSTLYHFRVNSRDASSNLATSSDATFTTTAPTVVISNVATTVSITYFTVTWTTNIVANSMVISGNNDFSTVTLDDSPMVTSHSVAVSGLSPCTEYQHIFIKSENNGGTDADELPSAITTRGCPSSIVDNMTLSIRDINTIAIRPSDPSDSFNYVYALNASGTNNPELSTIKLGHDGISPSEDLMDTSELATYNIPVSKQVFALRDYLYVLGDRWNPVAIFNISSEPDSPTYIQSYTGSLDSDPLSLYIRDMVIDDQSATVMFIGYVDKIRIIRMTPALEPGSPASPISPLEDPSVWAEIGALSFDLPKIPPYDIWVADIDHGGYLVYVKSDAYLFKTNISSGSMYNVMDPVAHGTTGLPNWVVGRNDMNDVFSTGDQYLNRTVLGVLELSAIDYTTEAKAISKTFPISPYIFVNTDQGQKEYRVVSVDGDGVEEIYDSMDLSGIFDGSHYGVGVGSSIGYMEDDGLIFYSKLNKLLIIDPGI